MVRRNVWIPFFLAVALGACNPFDTDDEPWECDLSIREIEFWVVDPSGKPQEGFVITVTNERTNEVYDVEQHTHTPGLYVALNDGFNRKLRLFGDPIRVDGEEGTRTFTADFVIASGRCHVTKLSGPDSVVVPAP